jgi:AcrR family transcriptional regulator
VAGENARTSRSTGPNARGQRSRAAILVAARRLFAASGFRGASMASVAAAVDLTQPGLLHHFPSKESLLHALLEEHYHDDGRRLNESLDDADTALIQALEALVEHNSGAEEAVRFFSVLVAESLAAEHPGHDYFKQRYSTVRSRLAASLRADQEAGRVRADADPDVLAAVIVAVMDGLQTQWLLDPSVDMVAVFRAFAGLIAADGAAAAGPEGAALSEGDGARETRR